MGATARALKAVMLTLGVVGMLAMVGAWSYAKSTEPGQLYCGELAPVVCDQVLRGVAAGESGLSSILPIVSVQVHSTIANPWCGSVVIMRWFGFGYVSASLC